MRRAGTRPDAGAWRRYLVGRMAGVEGHEGGVLALRREARVGYLAQEPELEAGRTILEVVSAGRPELLRKAADCRWSRG